MTYFQSHEAVNGSITIISSCVVVFVNGSQPRQESSNCLPADVKPLTSGTVKLEPSSTDHSGSFASSRWLNPGTLDQDCGCGQDRCADVPGIGSQGLSDGTRMFSSASGRTDLLLKDERLRIKPVVVIKER